MKDIKVLPDLTIHQAMKVLNKTAEKCLLVVDKNRKLLGTLTDGDLRRSILAGAQFSENISKSFYTKPTILIRSRFSPEEAKRLLHVKMLDLIPVVDENRVVVDYVTWAKLGNEISPKRLLTNVPVVVMAGGKGTRMEPFTKVLPKPLMPIREKPIIEHIIESFTKIGTSNFYITINYKGKILKAYFEELQPDYMFEFVDENEPLGTAGSLQLLMGKFDKPFFVTNCDIIVKFGLCGFIRIPPKRRL